MNFQFTIFSTYNGFFRLKKEEILVLTREIFRSSVKEESFILDLVGCIWIDLFLTWTIPGKWGSLGKGQKIRRWPYIGWIDRCDLHIRCVADKKEKIDWEAGKFGLIQFVFWHNTLVYFVCVCVYISFWLK